MLIEHATEDPNPTAREALTAHYSRIGLLRPGQSVDDHLRDRWVRMRVGQRMVPIKPLLGHQQAFLLHDVHHIVAGFDTSFRSELALAAWELGSGGCGWYVLFWLARFNALLLGLLMCPRRTVRAFRNGWTARNLYRLSAHDVLERDLHDLRSYVQRRDLR